MTPDYWNEINPRYIDLKLKIESIENRISNGIITNPIILKMRKKDLKRYISELSKTNKYL